MLRTPYKHLRLLLIQSPCLLYENVSPVDSSRFVQNFSDLCLGLFLGCFNRGMKSSSVMHEFKLTEIADRGTPALFFFFDKETQMLVGDIHRCCRFCT